MKQIILSYELTNDQYELVHNFLEEGFTLKQFMDAWQKLDGTEETLKTIFATSFPYATVYLWEKFLSIMKKNIKPKNCSYSITYQH